MVNGLHGCTKTRKVSGIVFKSSFRGGKNLEYSGDDSIETRDTGFLCRYLNTWVVAIAVKILTSS